MMRETVGNYERQIEIRPAYDKRDPDPKKDYGIHGVEFAFVVKGDKGAVVWRLFSDWHLRSAREHLAAHYAFGRGRPSPFSDWRPMTADLGYHAKVAQYDDQSALHNCEYTGGDCYYDGSGLNAEYPLEGFLNGGEEWLWPKLEAYYRSVFEGEEWPFADEADEVRARGGL